MRSQLAGLGRSARGVASFFILASAGKVAGSGIYMNISILPIIERRFSAVWQACIFPPAGRLQLNPGSWRLFAWRHLDAVRDS